MSPEPKLAPAAAPVLPSKPTLVPSPRPKQSHGGIWILLAVVAAGAAAFYWYHSHSQNAETAVTTGVRTIKVSGGSASPSLRVTGTTSARVYASVNAPVMMGPDSGRGLLLETVAKSGSVVKAGDAIAQLDTQAIQDHADDVKALVQQADDAIKRRRADQSIELENWRQSIRSAKALWDKAKLDYAARAIRTEIDREILKLNMDESEASYNNLVKGLEITQLKFTSQMTLLQSQKEQQVRHHNRHVRDVKAFTIHAPIGGLVVLNTIYRGGDFGQVQAGDQLSPGQPFAKVVDIRTMELDGSVNQSESQTIGLGQTARIHLDAFPQMEFSGKVISIGALGVSSGSSTYWVRRVPLRIAIEGADPQLIPDLSASADLQLKTPQNGILVPLEALGTSAGGTTVEIREGTGWKEVPVTVSSRSNTIAVVTSGLQAGDEIAVAHP
ncbi:MAG TPA: HlyD family efflux transporter periplasmic adaptor subunit [Bryobacteraceae bacterium]|jgi:multidrug efflux pump subunit AcrA (membrane-fusion protein)